ncbi:hypothetical protein DPMN_069350 [Dreissena polymorpha]|uniref:Uncharacterized protein n=1 Tax=Dreissena polymorpha TaxID=45954 RepID=A0A9D3Z3C5_DREPO|nr:hypothetical protein DPMN_069350 [Dreissena polymorpha]
MRRKNRQPKTSAVQETAKAADDSVSPAYASVVRGDNTSAVCEHMSSVKENIVTEHVINDVDTNNLADQQLNTEVVSSTSEKNVTDQDLAMELFTSTVQESLNIDELDDIARRNAVRFEENGGVSFNNYDEVKF